MSTKPWYKEGEMLVALCALTVSVCSLAMMVYEASLERKAQKAAIWPHLSVNYSKTPKSFGFSIKNSGIGPARIESVRVSFKSTSVPNWHGLLELLNGKPYSQNILTTYLEARVVSANENIDILKTDRSKEVDKLIEQLRDIEISICYCSVFDDCWITQKNSNKPLPIASCPDYGEESFML